MQTEYQISLNKWARSLSTEKLSEYMEVLDRFNESEQDALILEDIYRMQYSK